MKIVKEGFVLKNNNDDTLWGTLCKGLGFFDPNEQGMRITVFPDMKSVKYTMKVFDLIIDSECTIIPVTEIIESKE